MNYDKDPISILKQSSFIDCNYLRAAKDGSEVLQCFIAKSSSANSFEAYLLKIPLLIKLVQLIIHDNMYCIWYYSPLRHSYSAEPFCAWLGSNVLALNLTSFP